MTHDEKRAKIAEIIEAYGGVDRLKATHAETKRLFSRLNFPLSPPSASLDSLALPDAAEILSDEWVEWLYRLCFGDPDAPPTPMWGDGAVELIKSWQKEYNILRSRIPTVPSEE